MKKSLLPSIVAVIVVIVVVIFFYLTRHEVDETNTNTEQVAQTCQVNDDCIGTCTCGCIHINATCPTEGIDEVCESVPDCQCEDGACLEESLADANLNTNTNQALEEPVQPEPVIVETVYESNFSETGNLTGDTTTGFTLVYEEAGAPALTALLRFDYPNYASECTIEGIPMTCLDAMDQDLLMAGDLVTITGTEEAAGEIAVTMLDK